MGTCAATDSYGFERQSRCTPPSTQHPAPSTYSSQSLSLSLSLRLRLRLDLKLRDLAMVQTIS